MDLVQKAVAKGKLPYYDFDDVQEKVGGLNDNKRSEGKAKAFALGFAANVLVPGIDELLFTELHPLLLDTARFCEDAGVGECREVVGGLPEEDTSRLRV